MTRAGGTLGWLLVASLFCLQEVPFAESRASLLSWAL